MCSDSWSFALQHTFSAAPATLDGARDCPPGGGCPRRCRGSAAPPGPVRPGDRADEHLAYLVPAEVPGYGVPVQAQGLGDAQGQPVPLGQSPDGLAGGDFESIRRACPPTARSAATAEWRIVVSTKRPILQASPSDLFGCSLKEATRTAIRYKQVRDDAAPPRQPSP